MAYLDNYRAAVQLIQGNDTKLPDSIANLWPAWEVQSPQYQKPTPYQLAQSGYRSDELVYACIDYRAGGIAEPPARIYTGKKKAKKEVGGVFDAFPKGRPNWEMGEAEFWSATEIYRCIAGAAIWEIETNRMGEPINLWPLNPNYCSFLRGPNAPIRAVRYQYPGLPPIDIPRERLLIFMEFDPLYPMLKGLSRSAVALRSINVHTSTTDFLSMFFQRGMMIQGYLKAAQSLNDKEAERAQSRWRAQHGGVRNWAENNVAVLGMGMDYVPTQMDLRAAQFGVVDGRTEAAICMVFALSPLLLGAQVGLDASTLSNYDQAANQFLTRVLKPSWRWYSSELTQQLLPYLGYDNTAETYAEFDTDDVSAMKEDEDALYKRVTDAVSKNIMYRDEARAKLGLDPVDSNEKVFLGVTLGAADAPTSPVTNLETDFTAQQEAAQVEADRTHEIELAKAERPVSTFPPPEFSNPTPTEESGDDEATAMAEDRAKDLEEVRNGKSVVVFGVVCHTAGEVRKQYKAHWPRVDKTPEYIQKLDDAMKAAQELMNSPITDPVPAQPSQSIIMVEPTPMNINVEPTPILIENRVINAKPRRRVVRIVKDALGRPDYLEEVNEY